MSAGAQESTVSTDLLRILLGSAPLAQGELAEILALAGLEPSDIARSQERISTRQLARLWTEIEAAADDPNLGLHLGELSEGLPSGHVLFSAMLNSPTLGQALERYCRFHDIMGDFVRPRLTSDGRTTTLALSAREGLTLHRQHVECIFSLLASILKSLSSEPFGGQVSFAHAPPESIVEHHRVFGKGVLFSQPRNKLVLDRTYLELPIAPADPDLLVFLDQYAERLLRRIRQSESWTGKVSVLLRTTLCDGKPRLAEVARLLAVSQRSLQGRLKEEDTTYQEVLDTVRQELATRYLDDDAHSLSEIAFLLGFADQSAFNHAFRRWTGLSPQRYRQSS